ncbi:DUF4230 domain-containing protein [Bacillus dakarensis]|uniref:DUF4230 domain-containing protein n=1 Tax=Robertmurraya dakarensis TaxID=1926278 RepID=UPI0009808D9B|nr:DUF4230 domain-containing protein [Bacillus dakarensis]
MSKKDDEILAQLEAIRHELREGKNQTAGTAVIGSENRSLSFGTFIKAGFRNWKVKVVIFLIITILIGCGIGIGTFRYFAGSTQQVEKGSFIEQIQELSSLASSQAFVKAVIEKEDNALFGKEINTNIPGTKRKLLLVVPGTVTAGVDLQNIELNDVKIDEEEKRMEIILPRAEIIQDPSLDFDKVQTFSVEGIFRNDVNWEEAYGLASEAKALVKEEAIAQGLLEIAEENAKKTLIEFFERIGYDVSIQFVES